MKRIMLFILLVFISIESTESFGNEEELHFKEFDNTLYNFEEMSKSIKREILIDAIIEVESRNNPLAFNESELAAGVLQIRPIMVREVNRFRGYKKYSKEDRWNKEKSISMFIDYQNTINPEWDFEMAAKKWNGGPLGHLKSATEKYWILVKNNIEKIKEEGDFITFSIKDKHFILYQ